MAPQEESAKDWLRTNIQNSVKDGLGIRCDDISALRKAPGDGIQEPKEDCPDANNQVSSGDIGTKCNCVFAGSPGDSPCNPKECNKAEGEVSPLMLPVNWGVRRESSINDLPCKKIPPVRPPSRLQSSPHQSGLCIGSSAMEDQRSKADPATAEGW